jgi:hypothetical protein
MGWRYIDNASQVEVHSPLSATTLHSTGEPEESCANKFIMSLNLFAMSIRLLHHVIQRTLRHLKVHGTRGEKNIQNFSWET